MRDFVVPVCVCAVLMVLGFCFGFGFGSLSSRNNEQTSEIHYGDHVTVVDGFYEGQSGVVHSRASTIAANYIILLDGAHKAAIVQGGYLRPYATQEIPEAEASREED